MTSKHVRTIVLFLLALAFAIALTYASVQLPRTVSAVLIDVLGSAGATIDYSTGVSEDFIRSFHIRVLGFSSLLLVVTLIGIGLFTERTRWASAGAVALFLPVFGHFALNMSMLAGLGLLRVVWLPIIDHYPALLRFGDVAFLPYLVTVYIPALAGVDIRVPLIYGLLGGGILLFSTGAYVWFETRFHGRRIADSGIYRLSRHPQYLGWIVWSYGLMLFVARLRGPRIQWSVESTLPWVLAALILVCVALKEEILMRRDGGAEYGEYLSRSPFLFPVPDAISRVVSAPMRFVIRKEWPTNGRDVLVVFAVYSVLAIMLSLPFVLLDWPPSSQAMLHAFPYDMPPFR
jgi:protein-S-isoprenylcysteine O-methyltransferase Ste14